MKKILAVLVLVLVGAMSYAQWSLGPGNLYMLSAGNVGIGTTAPARPIDILHATNASIKQTSNYVGAALQTLGGITCQSATGNQFIMSFRKNAGGYEDMLQSCKIGATFAEFMYFRYDTQKWEMRPGVNEAEFKNNGHINFNNVGSIGIGMGTMAIPADLKLAVAGKIGCKEMEVRLTGFPDFVFNSDYKLRSLYDVENFINENKHLPDVPSATEVLENGLNVGDMSATLLQKVEELTLYMIQLQKENDALKARISNLEK